MKTISSVVRVSCDYKSTFKVVKVRIFYSDGTISVGFVKEDY
jgi:hypothetical protein